MGHASWDRPVDSSVPAASSAYHRLIFNDPPNPVVHGLGNFLHPVKQFLARPTGQVGPHQTLSPVGKLFVPVPFPVAYRSNPHPPNLD